MTGAHIKPHRINIENTLWEKLLDNGSRDGSEAVAS